MNDDIEPPPRRLDRLMRSKMLLLMLGGAVGTYCRYWVARWAGSHWWGQAFPFGTLIINVSGSFILGVVAGILLEPVMAAENERWHLLLGTGFCGGYTTFSTFSWETAKLLRDGSWWLAAANAVGSVVASVLGVFLALALVSAGMFGKR